MKLSDEEWLVRARARAQAAGSYDEPVGFEPLPPPAVATHDEDDAPLGPADERCPYCAEHPLLAIYPRYEIVTLEPLRYCPRCYGFWARKDALSRGVADPRVSHPALDASLAPGRCRLCFGRLDAAGACRDCAAPAPVLRCPACTMPMARVEQQAVTLDRCDPCAGVWFDMGEIARVYKLPPVPSLTTAAIGPGDVTADDLPPAWQLAAEVLLEVFLPFVRL